MMVAAPSIFYVEQSRNNMPIAFVAVTAVDAYRRCICRGSSAISSYVDEKLLA